MTDPFVVSEFFALLEETLANLNMLEKPEFIWNLDETSLSLDPTKTKVVGKIIKPCSRTTYGTGKENITVLATVNAAVNWVEANFHTEEMNKENWQYEIEKYQKEEDNTRKEEEQKKNTRNINITRRIRDKNTRIRKIRENKKNRRR
ncbi:unnamed protein product [Parnassius apollo]|uniref:(apollo) hypothetical protein n=1 Tax=Parnassius apollo TaxID=110799 RepID=A0A8S3Y3Q5_PARAO|nr:unnamed protein product [Parnassius apollo]